MPKPIRVMCGGFTNTIYAVRRYSERPGGVLVAATGGKDDVTMEAILAVDHHRARCQNTECSCKPQPWRCKCGELHPADVGMCPNPAPANGGPER